MVLPNPATACLGVHRLTRSHPSGPLLAGPDHTCSRENSREGEPSVLPSAVLAVPGQSRPGQASAQRTHPMPAAPHLLPKESSSGSRSPQCCRLQRLPCHASPDQTQPRRTAPSLTLTDSAKSEFLRTQQREPKPSVLRSAWPCNAAIGHTHA